MSVIIVKMKMETLKNKNGAAQTGCLFSSSSPFPRRHISWFVDKAGRVTTTVITMNDRRMRTTTTCQQLMDTDVDDSFFC